MIDSLYKNSLFLNIMSQIKIFRIKRRSHHHQHFLSHFYCYSIKVSYYYCINAEIHKSIKIYRTRIGR